MDHGNQSNSIEGNLPSDDAGSDSQGSPQGVVVQIVHNNTTLQSMRVDADALEQHSRFFRSRLSSNWCSSQEQQQQVVVNLHVKQPHHAPMAAALLTFIDSGQLPQHLQPQTANASPHTAATAQQQLCILAHLADRYQVPQLLGRVLRLLPALLSTHPCWQAVLFLLQGDQDSLVVHPSFSQPYRMARAFALRQLRDLEVVLQCEGLVGRLLQVPFDVLLDLVGGCDTRVAYESSVVAAITCWLQAQPPGSVSVEQLSALSSKVRFRGLPRCFISTVLAQLDWYSAGAGRDIIPQALMYLQPLDELRLQQAAAQHTSSPTQQHNSKGTSRRRRCGSNGSSDAVSPQEAQESRALGVVLQRKLREDDWWRQTLLAPRAKSAVTQLVLTADLSRGRLAEAYNSIAASSSGSNSSSWRLTRGGVGMFAGLHWTLCFRYVGTCSCSSKGACGHRQQQQQQQVAPGSKRKQREFLQQEEAAAAAAMMAAAAAAGAGAEDGSDAVLQRVLQESILQAQPDANTFTQQQAPAAAAAAAGAGNEGDGGNSSSSSGLPQPQLCSRIGWQLQFGVSCAVPYLPSQGLSMAPSLMLPPPSLKHRLARAPSSSMYTRGQKARLGFEPRSTLRLLEGGEVLPCIELLPLMLRSPGRGGSSSSSSSWDAECDRKLAPFVDGDGRLRVSTTISDVR